MKCPNCGNELKAGARFCTKCGTPVSQEINLQNESFNQEKDGSALPKEIEKKNSEDKKLFVWQEKYTYIAIVLAIVLAAGLGFMVKANKSSKAGEEEVVAEHSDEEHMDSYQELADAAQEDTNKEEFHVEDEEAGNDEYGQIQEEENSDDIGEDDEVGIHTYELVVEDVTWTEAYENCLRMGGHLVRINSDDEYNAILGQIQNEDKSNIKFWIGGYRDNSEYRWVYNSDYNGKDDILLGDVVINSDPMYKNYWLEGEPSFYDESTETEENRLNMFYMSSRGKWVWNDVPDDILEVAAFYAGTIGYICEYE